MHYRRECKHGTLVEQCRCKQGQKQLVIVDCPPQCDARPINLTYANAYMFPGVGGNWVMVSTHQDGAGRLTAAFMPEAEYHELMASAAAIQADMQQKRALRPTQAPEHDEGVPQ